MTENSFYDLKKIAAPHIYDIVLCRFPFEEDPSTPPDRRSPCLVLQVRVNSKLGCALIKVAFGTSNLKAFERGSKDLLIQKSSTLQRINLHAATRFELSNRKIAELPWCERWFPFPQGRSHPVITKLDKPLIEGLEAIRRHRRENNITD